MRIELSRKRGRRKTFASNDLKNKKKREKNFRRHDEKLRETIDKIIKQSSHLRHDDEQSANGWSDSLREIDESEIGNLLIGRNSVLCIFDVVDELKSRVRESD